MHKIYNQMFVWLSYFLVSIHDKVYHLIFTTIQVKTIHHEEYSQVPANSFQLQLQLQLRIFHWTTRQNVYIF